MRPGFFLPKRIISVLDTSAGFQEDWLYAIALVVAISLETMANVVDENMYAGSAYCAIGNHPCRAGARVGAIFITSGLLKNRRIAEKPFKTGDFMHILGYQSASFLTPPPQNPCTFTSVQKDAHVPLP